MPVPKTFERKDWNLDFRSELYKHEFYAADAWAKRRDGLVSLWDVSTSAELHCLRRLKDEERPTHVGEIIREQDGAALVGYWYELLDINSVTHPRTTELLYATMYLAGSVATYFKDRFHRARPVTLAPDLAPPIPTPRLPAYPGGHATQIYLMALTLVHLHPNREDEILKCAEQVARNREVAGVNYPSDTEAGWKLAQGILHILTSECELFKSALNEAAAEHDVSLEARVYSPILQVAESLAEGSAEHDVSLEARAYSQMLRVADSLVKSPESFARGRTS